jgi:uncharacterized membrane protein YccC
MALFDTLATICRTAAFALGRELAAWRPSRARASFGTQAVLSVGLSVVLANALNLQNTWWAAISGFAVMEASFPASVRRAIHRMLGTLAGALLGTIIGPLIGDRPLLVVLALGLIGGTGVYCANGSKAAYAWVLGAVTALMVTFEAHGLVSVKSTASFAALRVAEVAVGTLACVLVAGLFHVGAKIESKGRVPAGSGSTAGLEELEPQSASVAPPSFESLRPARSLLGLQAGLAVAILAAFSYLWHLPGFAQAMVTAIAVLILPSTVLAAQARRPIVERMVQRVAGCLLAGALGVALLPLTQGRAVLCILALSVGVWIGCHVQTGREGASYVGRQFTIAFIMVFVQDHHWSADPVPALMRLCGILSGIVVLAGVLAATSRGPRSRGDARAVG